MQRNKMVMVLLALGSNAEFKYPKYFQSAPFGPDPKGVLSNAFFEVAKTAQAGAQDRRARRRGCRILQQRADRRARERQAIRPADRLRPQLPTLTVDYTPIVRAIQATNPDVVLLASYPPDSVGMVRAATEVGLKTQLFGGAMVGCNMRR